MRINHLAAVVALGVQSVVTFLSFLLLLEPVRAGIAAAQCISERVCALFIVDLKKKGGGHLPMCRHGHMKFLFLLFFGGAVLFRIRNAALCVHELQSAAHFWEELKDLLKGAAQFAFATSHLTCRPVPQGQQLVGSCTASASMAFTLLVPLMWCRLVRILVTFLGDGFFCSLYFLKWTSV